MCTRSGSASTLPVLEYHQQTLTNRVQPVQPHWRYRRCAIPVNATWWYRPDDRCHSAIGFASRPRDQLEEKTQFRQSLMKPSKRGTRSLILRLCAACRQHMLGSIASTQPFFYFHPNSSHRPHSVQPWHIYPAAQLSRPIKAVPDCSDENVWRLGPVRFLLCCRAVKSVSAALDTFKKRSLDQGPTHTPPYKPDRSRPKRFRSRKSHPRPERLMSRH